MWGFVYMNETTKCVIMNSFYFHKWLWCMSLGVLPTCYWLSKYHCIENNGASLLDGQVEPKMSKKLYIATLMIEMFFHDMFNSENST